MATPYTGGADCFGHCWGQVWCFTPILFAECIFYIYPLAGEKISGSKIVLASWNKPLLFGFFFLCTNWGCFAWIEVVLHRLRLFCTDWGCPAQIEVALHRLRLPCTDWGCPAPILIEFESMKLFCCERRNSGLEGYMLKHFWEVPKREDQVGTWINRKSISTVWRISEVKKWLISEYGIGCPWPTPG